MSSNGIEFCTDQTLAAALDYRDARDAVLDPRGVTVRCTPWRRTILHDVVCGARTYRVFRKLRSGRVADAEREWWWLRELPSLGVVGPEPAFFARCGERTVVASLAVAGQPLDGLLGRLPFAPALDYAIAAVVPLLRRVHERRVVLRDAYLNHFYAESLASTTPPAVIDVERLMRPWWRWRRWVVKDLAGVVASWPHPAAKVEAIAAALVRAYRDGDDADLAAAVAAKARRIRTHRPKWG